MSFILANNTKCNFEKLEDEYEQTTRQLFDGKTIFRAELKHQFSGEFRKTHEMIWTLNRLFARGLLEINLTSKSLTHSKKKSPSAMRKEIEQK